ncbi:MAG: hypothetical protein IPO38_14435 [Rhodocyclaceae bacterium]|nr:hypothetical protein [Rhodocyclaceae bacterium]
MRHLVLKSKGSWSSSSNRLDDLSGGIFSLDLLNTNGVSPAPTGELQMSL